MTFTEFINNLSNKDKKNYETYSPIRGPITFRLVFNTLIKDNQNITYNDVNSFVKNDKALKDILFPYLAVIEEMLKTIIFKNYDIDLSKEKKEIPNYHDFKKLSAVLIEKTNNDEITELYKKFSLNFADIIKFVKEKPKYFNDIDINYLMLVKSLRDKTMHHLPLLFNYEGSTIEETTKQIRALISLLPENYKESFIEKIKEATNKTKANISPSFYLYTLKEVDINV